ncbi:MAG: ATP-binding cassette domain-containing protein, partial [Pseudomonadota bacterium]
MLEVRSLVKDFGNVSAVNDISFKVDEPRMIGVIGRSGAGKSTLLRILNRLTDATAGEVMYEGDDILKLKGKKKLEWQRRCAMIFQQFNLVPRLDVLTNVILG